MIMKTAAAILSAGVVCSAALAAMTVVLVFCADLGNSAPTAPEPCPGNLAESLKTALLSCQKESKALEESVTLMVNLPESASFASSALTRLARANSGINADRRVRRFGRGITVSPVAAPEDNDDEEDVAEPAAPASSARPSGTTAKRVRRQEAVTESEGRERRHAAESESDAGKVTPSGESEKEEKEKRSADLHDIVAVAGHHHKKDDDCDYDYHRRRRGAEQSKSSEMLSCAAGKLVTELPMLQKAIDACKEMDAGGATEDENEQDTQFEECFKNNLKEMCPDMKMIE